MKKLLFLPLFLLMSGCVSYYTPEVAIEDGVYYAEDDPAYINNSYVYNYDSYYPWASIDYFYFGASPYYPAYRYPSYSYGYGGYVGSGFSIGFSSGYYSPWYRPYYGYYPSYAYYSPWYGYHYPRYGYGYGYGYGHGRPGYGGCGHGNCGNHYGKYGKGNNGNYRGDRDGQRNGNRYVNDNRGNGKSGRGNRGNGSSDNYSSSRYGVSENEDFARGANNKGRRGGSDPSTDPVNRKGTRYVSTSPTSEAGNRGMVVRSQNGKEPQKSRTHQGRYSSVPNDPSTNNPVSRNPGASTSVDGRNGANKYRSRPTPVTPSSRPESIPGTSDSGSTNGRLSQHGSSEPDYRSNGRNGQYAPAKQVDSRTTPVRGSQPVAARPQPQAAPAGRPSVAQAPARQQSSNSRRSAPPRARAPSRSSSNNSRGRNQDRDRD